jgi:Raf kinase inhibitor-like YbhB/YbcL family protein
MTFLLHSSVFLPNEPIPSKYTCDGDDVSPPLAWMDAPQSTRSFALIVDDPDAPDPAAPKQVWVHWVLYDLPSDAYALKEGVAEKELPRSARQGLNDWKKLGYGGPCPPVGKHRYFFRLFALDAQLGNLGKVTRTDLEKAMAGHILGKAELMGTYKRKG